MWYPGAEPGGGSYIAQRMLAARSEKDALAGTLLFNAAHYALRPWPWVIVALASMVIYPSLSDIQRTFPYVDPKMIGHDMAYPAMLKLVKAKLFVEATNVLRAARVTSDDLHYCFVPGRIEFLGKHTDYAGGRSLICALERGFCVAASPRDDDRVRITDAGRFDHVEFSLSRELIPHAGHWSNYPMTVASRVAQNFPGAPRRRHSVHQRLAARCGTQQLERFSDRRLLCTGSRQRARPKRRIQEQHI